MAYEKQNFQSGQVLTAAEMNHIETGIVSVESETTNAMNAAENAQSMVANAAPYNLLDNSRFGSLWCVNQRGKTTYDTSGYTIDRWTQESASNTIINANDMTLSNGQTIVQKSTKEVIDTMIGKTYTLCIYFADGTIITRSSVINGTDAVFCQTSTYGGVTGLIAFFNSANSYQICRLQASANTLPFKAVALYEGDWTANPPAYHPKGYVAELAECQRYYQKGTFRSIKSNASTGDNWYTPVTCLNQTMRDTNDIIASITNLENIYQNARYTLASIGSVSCNGNQLPLFQIAESNGSNTIIGNYEISADL